MARIGSSEVLAVKPRVVILEFGGNDGLRGLPIETTRANLEQMIIALKKSGATVILAGMTLPPNYGPEYIRGFEQRLSGSGGEVQAGADSVFVGRSCYG